MGENILSITYVICFSGGHSSALCAVETVRRYGAGNCILLNHDISSKVEDISVKNFKNQVADALGMEITYANAFNFEERTPIMVALEKGCFAVNRGQELCTYELKTKPFYNWLKKNFPVKSGRIRDDICIVYGFEVQEMQRIARRKEFLYKMGYHSAFPLAENERTIYDIRELGIELPSVYKTFFHANCIGCLKAGIRSWYVCYCLRKDIFDEAVEAERKIGHSILKKCFLSELIPRFEAMKTAGVEPTDRGSSHRFWKEANSFVPGQIPLFFLFESNCNACK